MPNKPKTNALTRAIESALRKADLRDVVESIEPSQGLYASLEDPWSYAKIYYSRGVMGPYSSVTSAVSEVRAHVRALEGRRAIRGDDRHGLGKAWADKYNAAERGNN